MADQELQSLYQEASRRGMFTSDPDLQAIGHEMRARGMVTDPTQGGLVAPPAAAAPLPPVLPSLGPVTPLTPTQYQQAGAGPAGATVRAALGGVGVSETPPAQQQRQPSATPKSASFADLLTQQSPVFANRTPQEYQQIMAEIRQKGTGAIPDIAERLHNQNVTQRDALANTAAADPGNPAKYQAFAEADNRVRAYNYARGMGPAPSQNTNLSAALHNPGSPFGQGLLSAGISAAAGAPVGPQAIQDTRGIQGGIAGLLEGFSSPQSIAAMMALPASGLANPKALQLINYAFKGGMGVQAAQAAQDIKLRDTDPQKYWTRIVGIGAAAVVPEMWAKYKASSAAKAAQAAAPQPSQVIAENAEGVPQRVQIPQGKGTVAGAPTTQAEAIAGRFKGLDTGEGPALGAATAERTAVVAPRTLDTEPSAAPTKPGRTTGGRAKPALTTQTAPLATKMTPEAASLMADAIKADSAQAVQTGAVPPPPIVAPVSAQQQPNAQSTIVDSGTARQPQAAIAPVQAPQITPQQQVPTPAPTQAVMSPTTSTTQKPGQIVLGGRTYTLTPDSKPGNIRISVGTDETGREISIGVLNNRLNHDGSLNDRGMADFAELNKRYPNASSPVTTPAATTTQTPPQSVNLTGMGEAMGENLRDAWRKSVSETGQLPHAEQSGIAGQAWQKLTDRGYGTDALEPFIDKAQAGGFNTPQAAAQSLNELVATLPKPGSTTQAPQATTPETTAPAATQAAQSVQTPAPTSTAPTIAETAQKAVLQGIHAHRSEQGNRDMPIAEAAKVAGISPQAFVDRYAGVQGDFHLAPASTGSKEGVKQYAVPGGTDSEKVAYLRGPKPVEAASQAPAKTAPAPQATPEQLQPAADAIHRLEYLMADAKAHKSPEGIEAYRSAYRALTAALRPLDIRVGNLKLGTTLIRKSAATVTQQAHERLTAKYGDYSGEHPIAAIPAKEKKESSHAPVQRQEQQDSQQQHQGTSNKLQAIRENRRVTSSKQRKGSQAGRSDLTERSGTKPKEEVAAKPKTLGEVKANKATTTASAPVSEAPKPVYEGNKTSNHIVGSSGMTYTPRGTKVPFHYAVVPIEDLIPSHTQGMAQNTAYSQGMQPRDLDRAAANDKIEKISQELNLDLVGSSPTTADGAPLIGRDNQVESGNGRTLGTDRAYQYNKPSAIQYRSNLIARAAEFGIDAAKIKTIAHPILVRVSELAHNTTPERNAFAKEAGEPTIAAMSEPETAKSDAKAMMNAGFLEKYTGLNLAGVGNRGFVRDFVGIVPPMERNAVVQDNGEVSAQGTRRIRNAIVTAAYGDGDAVAKMIEDPDTNVKNIGNALEAAAPKMAVMRDRINKGERYPLDVTPNVASAVSTLSYLRAKGIPVAFHNDQVSMFGGDETEKAVLSVFDAYKGKPKTITAIMNQYADGVEALGDPAQTDLFGEKSLPHTLDMWTAARQEVESRAKKTDSLDFGSPETTEPAHGGVSTQQNASVRGTKTGTETGTSLEVKKTTEGSTGTGGNPKTRGAEAIQYLSEAKGKKGTINEKGPASRTARSASSVGEGYSPRPDQFQGVTRGGPPAAQISNLAGRAKLKEQFGQAFGKLDPAFYDRYTAPLSHFGGNDNELGQLIPLGYADQLLMGQAATRFDAALRTAGLTPQQIQTVHDTPVYLTGIELDVLAMVQEKGEAQAGGKSNAPVILLNRLYLLSPEELIHTLTEEAWHAVQFVRGDEMDFSKPYNEQPHEIEAKGIAETVTGYKSKITAPNVPTQGMYALGNQTESKALPANPAERTAANIKLLNSGLTEAYLKRTTAFRGGRFRQTNAISKPVSDALHSLVASRESGLTYAHYVGRWVLADLDQKEKDMLMSFLKDRRARDFENKGKDYNKEALPLLTPDELDQITKNPKLLTALMKHQAGPQKTILAQRLYVHPRMNVVNTEGDFFLSLIATKDKKGKTIEPMVEGPGMSLASRQKVKRSRFASEATGQATEYSHDYQTNLTAYMGDIVRKVNMKAFYKTLLYQKDGRPLPTETVKVTKWVRDAQGKPILNAKGRIQTEVVKDEHGNEKTKEVPSHLIYEDGVLHGYGKLAYTDAGRNKLPSVIHYNGKTYGVGVPGEGVKKIEPYTVGYKPKDEATAERLAAGGKREEGDMVPQQINMVVPEPIWHDFNDATQTAPILPHALDWLRTIAGFNTQLQLSTPTELVRHSWRVLSLISRVPNVGDGLFGRVFANLPGYGLASPARISALYRLWNLDMSDQGNVAALQRLMDNNAGSNRAFSDELRKQIPILGKLSEFSHDFLFGLPEGKGLKGFDLRARVLMEKIRHHVEGNDDPQRVREFASQWGQYTSKPDKSVEVMRYVNPFSATSLPMRWTEMKQLVGDPGFRGGGGGGPGGGGKAPGVADDLPWQQRTTLRAETLWRSLIGTFGTFCMLNYLQHKLHDGIGKWPWENDKGNETDLFLGRDKDGKAIYLNGTTGEPTLARPLRDLGIKDMATTLRGGKNGERATADHMALDVARAGVNALLETVNNPLASTALTAGVGRGLMFTKGHEVLRTSETAKRGESQAIKNAEAAVENINPTMTWLAKTGWGLIANPKEEIKTLTEGRWQRGAATYEGDIQQPFWRFVQNSEPILGTILKKEKPPTARASSDTGDKEMQKLLKQYEPNTRQYTPR